jgi:hypothetical protein
MATTEKKRLGSPKPSKKRKTQLKFEKRIKNNNQILNKLEL